MASTNESGFLGFIFKGAKIRWSDKAFAEFKRRVRKLTGRSWGVLMAYRFAKLAEYLRGFNGLFRDCGVLQPTPGDRPPAAPKGADVLPEKVAQVPHQSP